MSNSHKTSGKNLLFLISQPRSGSTMLQHILASNSQVLTLPEPWLMLQLCYARNTEGVNAEYNSKFAALALNEYLGRLPAGDLLFDDCIRSTALALYGAALEGSNKTRFLDKTPRYFFIIEDLMRLFPEAGFIFLVRNPLAVLASIISYNFQGDWWQMLCSDDRRHDLLTAPKKILKALRMLDDRCAVIKYENVVRNPATEVQRLCERLGILFEPAMLDYSRGQKFSDTTFVDTKSVYKHETAVQDYVDIWKTSLDSGVKIALARVYLDILGQDVIRAYGENSESLYSELDALESTMSKRKEGTTEDALRTLLFAGPDHLGRRDRLAANWHFGGEDRNLVTKLGQSAKIILSKV